MYGERIAAEARRAQRLGHGRDEAAGDVGVAGGERRDLVAAAVELDDELVDDALGAAVRAGGTRSIGGATWAIRSGRVMGRTSIRDRPTGGPAGAGPTASVALSASAGVGPASSRLRSAGLGRALLDLFLGLVAGTGTAGRADRATDDRTGRSGDRAADDRAGGAATERTGARAGLVVAFGSLTGDRAADGADRATDHRTGRATDGHADRCAAERTGAGADGLAAALLVLRGGAATLVQRSSSCG